ncbi:SAC3 family protein C isoform X2 [Dioscorea cayenensis subsp. rotundata]|uniref:SAC3 family protein C isoform X2 n=1 Tax=Dioscorea cayennensis subsp. rotundata TaxID=55577 RepID=A0AB40C903_DIOCR|nr:SAC3 family protein C isoform X2 [Dioscorea cayenensis subsp. rotundata]
MDKHLAAGRGGGSRGRGRKPGFYRGGSSYTVPSSSAPSWRPRRSDHTEPVTGSQAISDPSPSIPEQDIKSEHEFLIGTCPDMCPEKERAQRERLRDLSVFERLNGNPGRTSPSLAVKKFCRTMSTLHLQTSDIRPPSVLQNTLKYLLGLLESTSHPFDVVHDFIFDRTRSIRQDLTMQQIINEQAIDMYEEIVKFHITSHCKLARYSGKSDESSLYYLNMEQLMKCLLSIFDMYDMARRSKGVIKNEAEFRSYYVLLHLGCKIPTMGNSLSSWFCRIPFSILQSEEMCLARTLLRYYRMGDYKQFISTTATRASHLQLCLLEPFLNEVRAQALAYINLCGYKEQDLESLCSACGLETCIDEAGTKLLPAKQTSFSLPKLGFQSYGLLNRDTC